MTANSVASVLPCFSSLPSNNTLREPARSWTLRFSPYVAVNFQRLPVFFQTLTMTQFSQASGSNYGQARWTILMGETAKMETKETRLGEHV